jgi:hypothetical protein
MILAESRVKLPRHHEVAEDLKGDDVAHRLVRRPSTRLREQTT